jgi:hypothetical protein
MDRRIGVAGLHVQNHALLVEDSADRNIQVGAGHADERFLAILGALAGEEQAVDLAAVESPLSADLRALDLAGLEHAENRALVHPEIVGEFAECQDHLLASQVGVAKRTVSVDCN